MSLAARLARSVSLVLLISMSTALSSPPAEGAELWVDRQLNELADLKVLRFQGNKTFSDDQIRAFLITDPEVLSAGHRTAYLEDYVAMLGGRIAAAYRLNGFHDVDVKVDFVEKDKRIEIVIAEGKRFRYGEIRITGNASVSTAELLQWLTTPTPDEEEAVGLDLDDAARGVRSWIRADGFAAALKAAEWRTGETARFSEYKTTVVKSLLRRAYAEHGLLEPKFDVHVVPHDATAELLVGVRNEGAPAAIEEVEVAGHSRNDVKEILKLVDVKPGTRFDRKLRTRVESALWHSARFRNFTVTFKPGTDLSAAFEGRPSTFGSASAPKVDKENAKKPVAEETYGDKKYDQPRGEGKLVTVRAATKNTLHINVVESPFTPPLGTDLPPQQAAMLKFRAWFAESGDRGDDISLSVRLGGEFDGKIILSPGRGWLAEVNVRSKHADGKTRHYGFSSTEDQVGIYAFDQGKKYEFKPTRPLWNAQTSLILKDDPKEPIYSSFYIATNSAPDGAPRKTLQLRCLVAPATAAALARPKTKDSPDPTTYRVVDGVLNVEGETFLARIDASTGKLLSVSAGGSAIEQALSFVTGTGFDIAVGPGAFTKKLKQWEGKAALLANRHDETQPWHSALDFFLDDLGWDELDSIVTDELLQPLRIARCARETGLLPTFIEACRTVFPDPPPGGSMMSHKLRTLPARVAERAFPRESWPWVQTREFGLAWVAQPRFTREELERGVDKENWGPLALSFAAAGSKKFDFNFLADSWAEKGLKKLSAADFERDCKPLLAQTHLSGKLLHALAKFTRALDDVDAKDTIALVNGYAPSGAAFMQALRDEPKAPIDEVLTTSLRKTWNEDAQARVAGLMEKLLK